MIDNRRQLSEEVLGFDLNPSLQRSNAFLGLMLGLLAILPELLVFSGLSVALPSLPRSSEAIGYMLGFSGLIGLLWGYLSGERYNGISLKFNREYLSVYRDRVLAQQILWQDVESVGRAMTISIRTKQGVIVKIPQNALLRESHEVRSLRNHIRTFDSGRSEAPPGRWLAWSLPLLAGGLLGLNFGEKPYKVFETADVHSALTWLRILPMVVGGVCTMMGFFGLIIALQLIGNKKKPHPYTVTDTALIKKTQELKWDDVIRIHRFGSQDLRLRLDVANGKHWIVDCNLFKNGEELRDAILKHDPALELKSNPGPAKETSETIVSEGWSSKSGPVIILGLVGLAEAAIAVASIGWGWLQTRPDDPPAIGYLSAAGAVIMFAVIATAMFRMELTTEELKCNWLIGPKRRIKLSDIELIEIKSVQGKERVIDIMTVKSASSRINVSSSLNEYAEIRDSILRKVSSEKVRYS